jgi:hypothetical protein
MEESFVASCLYFASPGPKNTESLFSHVIKRASALGIRKVVIATNTGRTIDIALKYFDKNSFEIIAVTHANGYRQPDYQELSDQDRQRLINQGVKIVTAAHAFGGVARGVRHRLGTYCVDEIMAFTLRMLGQGVKVGIEIAYMAADRGHVRTDEDVLTISGTKRGADTAMVIKPAPSANCLDLKIREIIAKPWNP